MRTVTINFGGFYNSVHDAIVENAVAYTVENGVDDSGNINNDVIFDVPYETWENAKNKYAKKWLHYVLNDELETDFKFDCINSPKFYNYYTDVIIATYTNEDFKKVFEYIERQGLNSKVNEHIKRLTTYSSGYMPFYNEDEFREDNDLLLQAMLDVIIDELQYEDKHYYSDFEA